MKILGAWSGHDCSYCILEDGVPVIHDEFERFIREKEPAGDSISFLLDSCDEKIDDIKYVGTVLPYSKLTNNKSSFEKIKSITGDNKGSIFAIGHHQSHAANAFFSSNLKEAVIVTFDGGGVEQNNFVTACTIWHGKENKIAPIHSFPIGEFNIGGIWTRTTRYVFNLQSGWPRGHQAGTVMAMAALGDPAKYFQDFMKMLTVDNQIASHKPAGQPPGANVGTDPEHPYLQKYREIADSSEQEKFDLAAGLQAATESVVQQTLSSLFEQVQKQLNVDHIDLCVSGGVMLNSVMTGKFKEWFPFLRNVYIPPVPTDAGLTIGAAQYIWHHVLDNPRIDWKDNFTPYLGKTYSKKEVNSAIKKRSNEVIVEKNKTDDDLIGLLDDQHIVSVFGGGSESGRRALGNRSILADPRDSEMKQKINDKVKHRQWFRPFAPSILREEVKNWFTRDISSPYMNFVLFFKEEVRDSVPAVVHIDGSARLQTVTKSDNGWYYGLLKKWQQKTSVPILLNTSFNDREPICETPAHAIDCFLRTNIDYLYFYDYDILVGKKDKGHLDKAIEGKTDQYEEEIELHKTYGGD